MRAPIRTARRDSHENPYYTAAMTSVLEIEKAIEQLPEPEQQKLAEWFEDHRLVVESSAKLADFYDAEDGGESQLLDEP